MSLRTQEEGAPGQNLETAVVTDPKPVETQPLSNSDPPQDTFDASQLQADTWARLVKAFAHVAEEFLILCFIALGIAGISLFIDSVGLSHEKLIFDWATYHNVLTCFHFANLIRFLYYSFIDIASMRGNKHK